MAPVNSPTTAETNAAKLAFGLLIAPAKTTYISTNAAMKTNVPARAISVFKFNFAVKNS